MTRLVTDFMRIRLHEMFNKRINDSDRQMPTRGRSFMIIWSTFFIIIVRWGFANANWTRKVGKLLDL